jgi:hypothetical protein
MDFDRISVDLRHQDASGAKRASHHHGSAIPALDRDAHAVGVNLVLIAEFCLLEGVRKPFALGDLQGGPDALVVGAEAHHATNDRLVGAVSLTRTREGPVQLDARALWRTPDETPREQPNPARTRRVRRRRTDHDGTNYVE